ncbi:hypothetical protein ZWY2020_011210 [Hordeum vulgare]|nr:hypothetical protein ZWY2020_011210 [Hordeum vulgare]
MDQKGPRPPTWRRGGRGAGAGTIAAPISSPPGARRAIAMSQEEQCNGQGPATEEPSIVENADVVPVLEGADDRGVQNISIIEQGNLDHGSPGPGDGEDSAVKATNSDVGVDLIGAQLGEEVQVDSVQRTSSSDSKETMEVPIPSLDLRADNANMGEEGTREMEVGVSGRSSDGNIHDVEPTVSGETGMEVGHEAAMGLATSQEILDEEIPMARS